MKDSSLPINDMLTLDKPLYSPKSTSSRKCPKNYEDKYDLVLSKLLEVYKCYIENGFLIPDKIREAIIVFAGLDEDFFTDVMVIRSDKFGIKVDEETELDNLFVPVPNPKKLCAQVESRMGEEVNYVLGVLEDL
ncbi:hypothetical protein [Flagellimonas sp. 2504JD4-2]